MTERGDDLRAAVTAAADALVTAFPGAAVVVLAAIEEGGHSYPTFAWRGACLPVIGLLDVGGSMVRDTMPEIYR